MLGIRRSILVPDRAVGRDDDLSVPLLAPTKRHGCAGAVEAHRQRLAEVALAHSPFAGSGRRGRIEVVAVAEKVLERPFRLGWLRLRKSRSRLLAVARLDRRR